MRDDVIVRKIKLPSKIQGVVVPDHDGNFNIYINSSLAYEMDKTVLKHELEHIYEDHFSFFDDVKIIEK